MLDHIQFPDTPFDLLKHAEIICRRGSETHGTHLDPSVNETGIDDRDIMGVVIPPEKYYLGISNWSHAEAIKGPWDCVIYEFRKFVGLLMKSNPNVLGSLYLDDNDYLHLTLVGELLIENRKLFHCRKAAYDSHLGYARSQLKKMKLGVFNGYMGEKRKKLVEKFGYDCYQDSTTEFLTDSGWKKFDNVSSSDMLATVRIEDGEIEFQNYTGKTDKLYTGNLYVIEPMSSRCVVTENHKLLLSPTRRSPKNNFSVKYEEEQSDWGLWSPSEIMNQNRSRFHYRSIPENNKPDLDIADDYLILVGMFLSDGTINFRDDCPKSLRLTQTKKGSFHTEADRLISKYEGKKYVYDKETIWTFPKNIALDVYRNFGHARNKHLPNWCFKLSSRQFDILWKGLILGDGTVKEKNETLYTSDKQLADDIQAAATCAGRSASICGPYKINSNFGTCEMYQVIRSKYPDKIRVLNFKNQLGSEDVAEPGDGFPVKVSKVVNERVVCFEVPNGTLITRNGGNIAIHGNCKNACHLIRLLHMGIEYLEGGELHVRRTWDRDMLIEIKTGKWKFDDVQKYASTLFGSIDQAYIKSDLPEELDYDAIEDLVVTCLRKKLCV